jgi:hypothetical protein
MIDPSPEPHCEAALIARAETGDCDAQDAVFRRPRAGRHGWARLGRSNLLAEPEPPPDVVPSVFRQRFGDLREFEHGPNGFRNRLLTSARHRTPPAPGSRSRIVRLASPTTSRRGQCA